MFYTLQVFLNMRFCLFFLSPSTAFSSSLPLFPIDISPSTFGRFKQIHIILLRKCSLFFFFWRRWWWRCCCCYYLPSLLLLLLLLFQLLIFNYEILIKKIFSYEATQGLGKMISSVSERMKNVCCEWCGCVRVSVFSHAIEHNEGKRLWKSIVECVCAWRWFGVNVSSYGKIFMKFSKSAFHMWPVRCFFMTSSFIESSLNWICDNFQ